MAKIKTNKINFNGEKLRGYLTAIGYSQEKLSAEVGRSKAYINQAIASSQIYLSEYKVMCMILGVDETMFEFTKKEEVQDSEEKAQESEGITAILDTLFEIVIELKRLSVDMDEIKDQLNDIGRLNAEMVKIWRCEK